MHDDLYWKIKISLKNWGFILIMTNLHTTTALTEFAPLSPEQEQSSVGSFFAKVFNFKTSPTDANDTNAEMVVSNVSIILKTTKKLLK